jgi:uncharacterized protein
MALVQTDVLAAAKNRRLAPGLDGAGTYIAKLYNEELHLLARPDVKSVQDLQGKKVNFGIAGGGTAITAPRVFQLLKIPVEGTSFDAATAIEKVKTGEIAAMAFVAGKPAPLFIDPAVAQGLRLVPIPLQTDVLNEYLPSRFTSEDYPSLVKEQDGVDTIAVGIALMVANLPPETDRYKSVAAFVDAFFTQFPKFLETPRHPKWKEVSLTAELPGWRRFGPAEQWLKKNAVASPVVADVELREIFDKFVDERSRISGGRALTAEQKNGMFEEFQRWQSGQSRR